MAMEDKTRVIGYFAFSPPMDVVCDGDACVIAGSEDAMKGYIAKFGAAAKGSSAIRKTRFGEILTGMLQGGAYAFDEESYSRFQPLAAQAGIDIVPQDFSVPGPTGMHFVRVAVGRCT